MAALAAAPGASPQFSSAVHLVEVYATVTDKEGLPVKGLRQEDFAITEDGEHQQISTFVAGEFPLAVALAIDRSFSMTAERLALAKLAARSFLSALRPDDQAMIIAIGSQVEVVAPLTTDRAVLFGVIQNLDRWGTTALHDAIVEAVNQVQPATGRRALVLLSDGVDRYSRISAAATLEQVRQSDVLVYPIALGRERPPLFPELAVATGGGSFHQRDPRRLSDTLTAIAGELRHQYLLGYSPSRPMDATRPEWRAIRVAVANPDLRVRARDGYMAR